MFESLLEFTFKPVTLAWISIFSLAMLVLIIAVMPFVIGALPDDYFKKTERPKKSGCKFSPINLIWVAIKNLLGIIFLFMGIAMLVLPGQGLLTIFVGLLLINYPGKFKLERKFLSNAKILKLVNWIRFKQGKNTFNL